MCGIPMHEPSDATTGRKLTLEQALQHIGGADNLITENGHRLIDLNRVDYLWKYPGHAYCTFCGQDVGDFKARHNAEVTCPACGRGVIFKHESRGHHKVYDEFCLYEWRKSVLDPEVLALTAAHIWRDSTRAEPQDRPLHIDPTAIYILRPGRAVTVYRRSPGSQAPADNPRAWWRVENSVAPDHTARGGGRMDIVMDYGAFLAALRGTRIGATFQALHPSTNQTQLLELTAIANCARRPWLEYLHKCGQDGLAAELMNHRTVSREIIPNPRANNPRALLGITEAQWHEIRRDDWPLTAETLMAMARLRRMGLGDMHMDEIDAILRGDGNAAYHLDILAPSVRTGLWRQETACDILRQAGLPDKLIRKAMRRIVTRDLRHAQEWLDYYYQLRRLAEDLTDTALLLPRDMPAMHQRMIERENLLRDQAEARRLQGLEMGHRKRLRALQQAYTYTAHGLTLRPYETAAEVIREGAALHICIGSYAERYLKGDTILCCLRQANEPDEPWRAVEFSAITGSMVQDRGAHNDTKGGVPPGTQRQLDLFWAAFERHRQQLHKKGRRKA